jgi:adenylate kinase
MRIIVLGISGVGKTTACREYVVHNPEFLHLTASELIRNATGVTLQELMTADAMEIMRNQLVLQKALQTELQKRQATKVIIDGQCVLDNGREIVILPVDLVAPLRPTGFILLEDEPAKVLQRRLNDSRERPLRTAEELSAQMEMNRVAVRGYATTLMVPLVVTNAGHNFSLEGSIARLSLAL